MTAVQLELFREVSDVDMIREEVRQISETTANVRRGLFARQGELARKYVECQMDIEELRVQIAQLRSKHNE